MPIKRKSLTFYWVVIVLAVAVVNSWGLSNRPPEPNPVPGKVLVKFQDGVTPEESARIVEKEGGTVKSFLASTGVHIIVLPEDADVSDAVDRFTAYPEVQYAEPVLKATLLEE